MDDRINLAEKIAALRGFYQPGIVARVNDYKVAVVRAKGEFVWHSHADTDDFFLVLDGRLVIQLRDPAGEREVELGPGEVYVVPKGIEHCPRAAQEAHVLLIEPTGTPNTGDAAGAVPVLEREI